MLAKLRALALILAFIAAAVPSFMYITDANRDWLWLHIGINIFAHIMVALTTIQTTLDVAGRAKHKLPVPARFEHNPILAKWWTAVCLSWRWHALAALARVGLAHALAQHLHIIHQTMNDFQGILSPFFTVTHFYVGDLEVRSQWITSVVAGMLLLIFGLAETGFISAATLLFKPNKSHFLQVKGIIFLRSALILAVIGIMLIAQKTYKSAEGEICSGICCTGWYGPCGPFSDVNKTEEMFSEYNQLRQNVFLPLKTAHRIGFTLLDNGTMMAAETMLPIGEDISFYQCYERDQNGNCIAKTNLPHVLNKLALSMGGLSLYAALTAFCLWLAQRRYARRRVPMPQFSAHAG
jgi:hypothetical protein